MHQYSCSVETVSGTLHAKNHPGNPAKTPAGLVYLCQSEAPNSTTQVSPNNQTPSLMHITTSMLCNAANNESTSAAKYYCAAPSAQLERKYVDYFREGPKEAPQRSISARRFLESKGKVCRHRPLSRPVSRMVHRCSHRWSASKSKGASTHQFGFSQCREVIISWRPWHLPQAEQHLTQVAALPHRSQLWLPGRHKKIGKDSCRL